MANAIARIVVRGGEYDGKEFPLKPGENHIGRLEENDIVLRDRSVSRRHAVVRCQGDLNTIEDLGSYNGIEVGGKKVQRLELENALTFKLGDFDLTFLTEERPTGPQRAEAGAMAMVPQEKQPAGVPQIPANWQALFGKTGGPTEEADAAVVGAKAQPDAFVEKSQEEFQTAVQDESGTRRGLILYITVLVAIVVAGLLVLNQQTKRKLWEDTEDHTLLIGQGRVYTIGEYREVVSDDDSVAVPEPMQFLKEDPTEVLVFVKVKAMSDGLAHIKAVPSGRTLRIIVKGKVSEDEQHKRYGALSPEQRLHVGRLLLRSGISKAHKDELAAALKDFVTAERVLSPVRVDTSQYLEAKKKKAECQEAINERVVALKKEFSTVKHTDDNQAILTLQRILNLIPDPDDPEHQMVKIILDYRLNQKR
jgi:hypothetical protein